MTQAVFKFTSDASGGDQFTVVSFTGREHISELYRYDIELRAPLSADIDLDDILDSYVHFVIEQNGVEYPVNGILSSFEEFKTVQNYAHFNATLVPRIWKLSNYKTNEIFYSPGIEDEPDQGQTVAEIIVQVLEKAGVTSSEYDIGGLSGKLIKREYVCQYNESDFDFISRLMENEGIFYYFEQDGEDERIVFVNDLNYLSIPRPRLIFDVAAMASNQDETVYAWSCRKQRQPLRVVVRDYNPDEPSLDVSDTMPIDNMGQGTEYIYGKNVHSDNEATYLSEIRAEQHICRKTQYFGESSVTRMRAGYMFLLEQHPNDKYNGAEYLVVEINHEGQSLDMAIGAGSQSGARPQYQNSFVAVSADIQYRPELKTKKPKITGTLHARIDGELDSEYAQLDSQGRYKVSMPFDFHNDDHPEGLASARVRMIQPYAGANRGMQFPMAKGTDVLLSFVDGDPDRPIIAGAINTAAAPGPVVADNQTESVIQTGGNNKIRFEDEAGSERIILESPKADSWLRIGTPNDPLDNLGDDGSDGVSETADDGIRINSGGSIWTEALGKYGEFIAGAPTNASIVSSNPGLSYNSRSVNEMLVNFDVVSGAYKIDGLKTRDGGTTESFENALNKAHIKVSSLDTFTTQEGNIYDFGGYWNYDLGNSFAEGHIIQTATLNEKHAGLWPTDKYNKVGAIIGGTIGTQVSMFIPPIVAAGLSPNAASTGGAIAVGIVSATVAAIMIDISTAAADSDFQKDVGDVIGGPGKAGSDGTIKTWAGKVGSSFKNAHPEHGQPYEPDSDGFADKSKSADVPNEQLSGDDAKDAGAAGKGPMHTDTTWVQKSFGDSYEFTSGNSIEIRHGHAEEHTKGDVYEFQYGGNRESTSVSGEGIKTAWERSGGGSSEETHWDKATGQFVSYEYKNHGHFSFSVSIPTVPTLSLDLSLSSMDAKGSVSAGTSINFSAAASMSINATLTAGLHMNLSRAFGGSLDMDESTGYGGLAKIEFNAVGMSAATAAALKAEKKNAVMEKIISSIIKTDVAVTNDTMKTSSGGMWTDTTAMKFF